VVAGLSERIACWPTPERLAFKLPAPVATVSAPVRVPVALGAKETVTVQELPTASELAHVVDAKEKSAPVTLAAVGVVTVSGPLPVLVNVAVAELEAPTAVAAKLGVESEADCATPAPVTARDAEVEGAAAEAVKLPL
jgi:hypothetical protein